MTIIKHTLIPRSKPCICVSCPVCGSVFMTSALDEKYHKDDHENREILNYLARYARQGYNIEVKDATEFEMNYCEHLNS